MHFKINKLKFIEQGLPRTVTTHTRTDKISIPIRVWG